MNNFFLLLVASIIMNIISDGEEASTSLYGGN